MKQKPQTFTIYVKLRVKEDGKRLTEAGVKRWVEKRIKDCEHGEIKVTACIED